MRLLLAISALSLAAVSMAQRETITLPWANGDTVVVSLATDADGDTITQTLSTVNGQAAATTPATKKPAAGAGGGAQDEGNANGRPTTTGPRVVGVDSTAAPMRTTTYWYDPGSGVWTSQVWTASVTAAPTVATVNVPAGTIQNYNSYQTEINSVVFKSAEAAAISASGVISGNIGAASRRISPVGEVTGIVAWTTVVVGMIGAGFAVIGL